MSFDSIVHEILNEGKKESEALLVKTFPSDTELQQQLLALDQTPSKGDVPAIIKFYNENKDIDILTNYFNLYSKLKAKNIPIKAPSSFKTFIEFTEHVDATETKQKLKGSPIAPTIEHEDSADKLVDTEELTIYKGDAQHKCVKYGEGYSFCISRSAGGNMYDSYRFHKESTFYFIFFKKIPKTNPDHVLVLDHTKNGWEWTNQLNQTKETTWKEVVAKFPVLAQYANLFVNKPLADKEKVSIQFLKDFKRDPSLKKFLAADKNLQILALKTGETITDEIFTYLTNNNAWDYINEYVSVGPNLTPLQADAVEAKGGAILKQYLKIREVAIPQLEQHNLLKINKLDKTIQYVQQKIEKDYKKAWDMVAAGKYILTGLMFLDRLPDNIPESITGDFDCSGSNQLTSLEGAPKSVGGYFNCSDNQLTSLEGVPKSVGGNFYCSSNQLTSLEGAPKSVGGDFDCYNNNLTSLEGVPKSVGGNFYCSKNQLTSLEGAPQNFRGSFNCTYNQLTSLEGAPKSVGGDFNCSQNQLTSLEGAPEIVKRYFDCAYNQLTSLEGSPKSVGSFNCCNNKLVSLKGIPMQISADFYCDDNPVKFTINDIKAAMAESKRKLEKQNESVISNQFDEGYKEILTAILGIGAAGLFYDANRVQRELDNIPGSQKEKITAIKQADKEIKSSKFHQVANEVLTKLKATDTKQQPSKQTLKLGDSDEAVYSRAVQFILPSEILGTDIKASINNKFMKPYLDDVKKWTIGVGHLIGKGTHADRKAYIKARQRAGLSPTLSRKEALALFHKDVSIRVPRVKAKFAEQWDLMSLDLKAALVDIEFRGDLEKKGPGDFKWVEAIKKGEFKQAADMYLDHKEYKKRKAKGANDGVVKRMNRNAEIIRKELVPATKKQPLL